TQPPTGDEPPAMLSAGTAPATPTVSAFARAGLDRCAPPSSVRSGPAAGPPHPASSAAALAPPPTDRTRARKLKEASERLAGGHLPMRVLVGEGREHGQVPRDGRAGQADAHAPGARPADTGSLLAQPVPGPHVREEVTGPDVAAAALRRERVLHRLRRGVEVA